jgi:hypothetical protein
MFANFPMHTLSIACPKLTPSSTVPTSFKKSNRLEIQNIFVGEDETLALAIANELKYLVEIVGRDS